MRLEMMAPTPIPHRRPTCEGVLLLSVVKLRLMAFVRLFLVRETEPMRLVLIKFWAWLLI